MVEQVDPQTPGTVQGYRKHAQEQVDAVNAVKVAETALAEVWKSVRDRDDVDKRMVAIARTNFEDGFMWLVRSIFRPDTNFDS